MSEKPRSETTIPRPSKEAVNYLQWAVAAIANEEWATARAMNAYYLGTDYTADFDAARKWLVDVEKACGY